MLPCDTLICLNLHRISKIFYNFDLKSRHVFSPWDATNERGRERAKQQQLTSLGLAGREWAEEEAAAGKQSAKILRKSRRTCGFRRDLERKSKFELCRVKRGQENYIE